MIDNNVLNGGFNGNAIINTADLALNNTTVSGNTGVSSAIYNLTETVEINSSTITDHPSYGIENLNGTVRLQNTILAGNGSPDCCNNGYNGTVESLGYNLVGSVYHCSLINSDQSNIDPLLGLLQDNGGSTYTQSLLDGSPAVNAGNPAGCSGSDGVLATDQRGLPRVGRCDIGAFELQWDIYAAMEVTPTTASSGDLLAYTITVQNETTATMEGISLTDTLPASLLYKDGSLGASSGTENYNSGIITWNGSIGAKGESTIYFEAQIDPSVANGTQITNMATVHGAGKTLTPSASVDLPLLKTFLPLITKPEPGIYGRVTNRGENLNAILYLLFFNGSSWSVNSSTSSDESTGMFKFTPPALAPGQKYCVRYGPVLPASPSNYQNLLFVWFTREITEYSSAQSVYIGDIDVADVPMILPAPGATVSLPVTFQWIRRETSPTDSYQLELYDPNGTSDFITPPLGFTDSYAMTQLPSGFSSNIQYGWTIWINAPDGGYGLAYYSYAVAFSNRGNAFRGLTPTVPQTNILGERNFLTPRWTP